MQAEKEINNITAFLMVSTAIFFDLLQLIIGWIPVVGNALAVGVDIFTFGTFFLWLYIYGIKMIKPQRLFSMIGASALEAIPYVDLLPMWTITIIYIIGTTRVKEFASKHSTIAGTIISAEERFKNRKLGGVINGDLDKAA